MNRHRLTTVIAAACVAGTTVAAAEELTGIARVVDGRTIEIGARRLRLAGIDTPEPGQSCERRGGAYDCGQEAAWALAERLGRHWVLCIEQRRDSDGVILATCYLGGRHGIDVNAYMVRRGWAVADPDGNGANYADAEAAAQGERAGLWAGAFVHPAQFRARRRL